MHQGTAGVFFMLQRQQPRASNRMSAHWIRRRYVDILVAPRPSWPLCAITTTTTTNNAAKLSLRLCSPLYCQGAIGEAKFIRTLRQIENEAIQAPSAKAGATPLSEEVKCNHIVQYHNSVYVDSLFYR